MNNFKSAQKRSPGFTLVEMLIVLLVIVVLGVMAYGNKELLFGKIDTERAYTEVNLFIDALDIYSELNNNLYTSVTVEVLIDNGYMKDDDYTDGVGENTFSDDIVITSINSGADAQIVYTTDQNSTCQQLKARFDNVDGLTNSCTTGVLTSVKE